MLVIVSYDISSQKRRTKVHKLLKGFGDPVQRSVFECPLEPQALRELKNIMRSLISRAEDSVLYYPLCRKCSSSVDQNKEHERPSQMETVVI